jgi:hypothetical protein
VAEKGNVGVTVHDGPPRAEDERRCTCGSGNPNWHARWCDLGRYGYGGYDGAMARLGYTKARPASEGKKEEGQSSGGSR